MIITGYVTFDNTTNDYISTQKPPSLFGIRKYVDIAHGQNLSPLNNVRLSLIDVSVMSDGVNRIHRSGQNAMCGKNFGDVYFRNIPHWCAIDSDNIRVWATMSRDYPTVMRFYYVLETI